MERLELTNQERDGVISEVLKMYRGRREVRQFLDKKYSPTKTKNSAQDAAGIFMRQAGEYALLTPEEEILCGRLMDKGIETYHRLGGQLTDVDAQAEAQYIGLAKGYELLFACNRLLVVHLARTYYGAMPFEDLLQEGSIGLAKSVQRFDSTRGIRFSTFAAHWIRQHISRAIADKSRTVRLPIKQYQDYRKAHKVSRELANTLNREPTAREIADHCDLSEKKVAELLHPSTQPPSSLDAPIHESIGERSLGETIPDEGAEPESMLAAFFASAQLKTMMDRAGLPSRQKAVLGLTYGLPASFLGPLWVENGAGLMISYDDLIRKTEGEQMSLSSVAKLLQFPAQTIVATHAKALGRLRRFISIDG